MKIIKKISQINVNEFEKSWVANIRFCEFDHFVAILH